MSEATVRVEKDDGHKRQWAKRLFYHREGRKDVAAPRLFAIAFGLVFLVGSGYSLLSGPSEYAMKTKGLRLESQGGSRITNVPPVTDGALTAPRTANGRFRNGRQPPDEKLMVVRRNISGAIPPGSVIKAKLITGASNGPLRAETTSPLIVNGETIIESGTVVLGNGQSSEERLFIRFSRLVFKDGSSAEIQAQGCDVGDQIVGLKGNKVGSYALKLAAAAGLNFAGGVAAGMQDAEGQNGVAVKKADTKNALLNGSSEAALEEAKDVLSNLKTETPIIEVEAGKPLIILVQ